MFGIGFTVGIVVGVPVGMVLLTLFKINKK